LAADEGNRLLATLVRVDFVDAQRNIDDDDSSRSNRLSAAFAAFYRRNLEQATIAEAAHRILDAQKKGDSRKSIDLLRHSSPSFAIDGPNAEKTLSEMIGRSREVLTELSRIWSSGSMRDVFNYCRDAGLIKLPDRLLAHLKRQPRAEAYDEDQHAPEKEDWLVDAYLAMSPTEVGLYSAFIQDNTAYSTQHGVKGEEYKDVLVVYDDIEAAWTHYNFTKILTPATAGNPTEGQLDRGRKLAYVCFSRSTENLRVMLFTPNPKAAAQELINRGLIKEDQVRIQ
jgi:DNA helicase-2/ATP-dependent DNA helicase PcrA